MTTTTSPLITATPTPSTTTTSPRTAPLAVLGRRTAVVGLVAGAALNTAEAVLLQLLPERPEAVADQLALVSENAGLYGTRAVLGTLAVPFMAVGFVGAGRLLAMRAPRTARVAVAALLTGMAGFLGIHLLGLLQLPASRVADREGAAAVLEAAQSDPLLGALVVLPFLVGCFGGMLLLGAALLRTAAVPRWIGAALVGFIVLDFTVGAVGPVDPHWVWLAAAVGLAVQVARTSEQAWWGARPANA